MLDTIINFKLAQRVLEYSGPGVSYREYRKRLLSKVKTIIGEKLLAEAREELYSEINEPGDFILRKDFLDLSLNWKKLTERKNLSQISKKPTLASANIKGKEKEKMSLLSLFYLLFEPGFDYLVADNWLQAYKMDIGRPILKADVFSYQLGKPVVYQREFTNGLILFRPNKEAQTPILEALPIICPLDREYYLLLEDGSTKEVSEVALSNGEGVVLVKEVGPDSTPPARIDDLKVVGIGYDLVNLVWTAPGDDGTSGQVASYEVRYRAFPIESEADWNLSLLPAEYNILPLPKDAGKFQIFTLIIKPETEYYFAVRARDEAGNLSFISNTVMARTRPWPKPQKGQLFPSVKSDAILFGGYESAEWTAKHFDAILGLDADDLAKMRKYNPNIKAGLYVTCGVVESEWQSQEPFEWCKAHNVDYEDLLLHMLEDTVIVAWETGAPFQDRMMRIIPGWDPANDTNKNGYLDDDELDENDIPRVNPKATAKNISEAKIPNVYQFRKPQSYYANPGSPQFIEYMISRIKEQVYKNVNGHSLEGIWHDDAVFPLEFNFVTCSKKPQLLEYKPEEEQDYVDDCHLFYAKLVEALPEKEYGDIPLKPYSVLPEHCYINPRSCYIFGDLLPVHGDANIYGRYTISDFEKTDAWSRRRQKEDRERFVYLYWHEAYALILQDPSSALDRDKNLGLAYYYLLADPEIDYHFQWDSCNYGGWEKLLKYFPKAFYIDLGQPNGGNYIFAEGQDPSNPEDTYKVFARDYTKGMVLAKPKPNGQTRYHNEPSITRHRLPGVYFRVQADGTIGSESLTEITLMNAEAVILLAGTDTTPPEPIKDLELAYRTPQSLSLAWTTPADGKEKVMGYEVYYGTFPLNDDNLVSGKKLIPSPAPDLPGKRAYLSICGLLPETTYYFALRSIDKSKNLSPASYISGLTLGKGESSPAPMLGLNPQHTNYSELSGDSNPQVKWEIKQIHSCIAPDGTMYGFWSEYWGSSIQAIYPDGRLKWKMDKNMGYASLALGEDGMLYAFDGLNGILYAIKDAGESAFIKWQYKLPVEYFSASPVIAPDGTIYLTLPDGDRYSNETAVYAFTPSGELKWRFGGAKGEGPTDAYNSSPPAISKDGNRIIFYTPVSLYCLDADGNKLWEMPPPSGAKFGIYYSGKNVGYPIIRNDGRVVVFSEGSSKSYLLIDVENGSITNRLDLKLPLHIPAIDKDNNLYLGWSDGWGIAGLCSYDQDLKLRWEKNGFSYRARSGFSDALLDSKGRLYVVTGRLYGLADDNKGTCLWVLDANTGNSLGSCTIRTGEGHLRLYIGQDNSVYATIPGAGYIKIGEWEEPAEPELTLQSFSPGRCVNNAETIEAEIQGENFKEGLSIELSNPSCGKISGKVLEFGTTTLRVSFAIKGKGAGKWNLIVTNPGSISATLFYALQIEEPKIDFWLGITGKTKVYPGYSGLYTFTLKNTGNIPCDNVEFILSLPEGVSSTQTILYNGTSSVGEVLSFDAVLNINKVVALKKVLPVLCEARFVNRGRLEVRRGKIELIPNGYTLSLSQEGPRFLKEGISTYITSISAFDEPYSLSGISMRVEEEFSPEFEIKGVKVKGIGSNGETVQLSGASLSFDHNLLGLELADLSADSTIKKVVMEIDVYASSLIQEKIYKPLVLVQNTRLLWLVA